MSQIAERTVVITGAASGIGRLMALGFAARGATVAVLDRNAEGARLVAKELRATSGRTHLDVEVDITDVDAVAGAAATVLDELGEAHVLVNNAGIITSKATVAEATEEEIRRTFEVNTLALFWVTKAFLPGMVARDEGHVVTIGSASGMVGVSRLVAYASSKHAAIGFDESLRMELSEIAPGVRTTIVNPYYIDTGMFEGVRTKIPWLLPILKEQDVADAVIQAVARNRSRVIMPPAVKLLPVMHALPVAAFDWAVDLLGVNDTMKTFTGRR